MAKTHFKRPFKQNRDASFRQLPTRAVNTNPKEMPPPVPSFSFFVAPEGTMKKSAVELIVPVLEKDTPKEAAEEKVIGIAEVKYVFNPRNPTELK